MRDKFKEFAKNRMARKEHYKHISIAGAVIIGVAGMGYLVSTSHHGHLKTKAKKAPNMTGVLSTEFSDSVRASAIEKEDMKISSLTNSIKTLQKSLDDNKKYAATKIQSLAKKLKQSQVRNENKKPIRLNSSAHNYAGPQLPDSITGNNGVLGSVTTSTNITAVKFEYKKNTNSPYIGLKNPNDYVPTGTFARAVMLGGADADASVNGQSNTTPVLFRILDSGTLPNNTHSHLKGCFVLASVYGDISSERGNIRLNRISCVKEHGEILDVPVEGTVYGMGGKNGVRGTPVMRNGKILMYAGLSGAFSGIGSAMQQSLTTQSVSPQGVINTVSPGRVMQYGAYGGANTALSKLSDYYIKRADQYHPVIQLPAGNLVDIVFQKGFSINPKSKANGVKSVSVSDAVPKWTRDASTLANVDKVNLGDEINVKQPM